MGSDEEYVFHGSDDTEDKGTHGGGASTVHVNQDFTKPVKIKRGVRQGYPLAPLLFALSTQPLMEALQEAEDTGELKGLQLPNMKAITHEIFADDNSIFISAEARDFLQVKSIIHKFELASGEELNVHWFTHWF
ncbi:hypothetical protein R1flu_011811 [Riccia fluitans]|uniref:Reverse transcriptase domain-containing protein n=1 Tax=Riccia fluitans TaxID=41844 RepID=A0ABD1ZBD8_9MARC